jgi:hypothetical protein
MRERERERERERKNQEIEKKGFIVPWVTYVSVIDIGGP